MDASVEAKLILPRLTLFSPYLILVLYFQLIFLYMRNISSFDIISILDACPKYS